MSHRLIRHQHSNLVIAAVLALTLVLMSPALNLMLLTHACNRYRTYGEPCATGYPYAGTGSNTGTYGYADSSMQCSPYRQLTCDRMTGTCRCPDHYNYYWDGYQGQCYVKIGSACKENYGGLSESWYNHFCPDNSRCNPATGYCECLPLFMRNYDYTGCNSSSKKMSQIWNLLLGLGFPLACTTLMKVFPF